MNDTMKEFPLRVRLTEAENNRLLTAVARSGLSKSEFVRWALENSISQALGMTRAGVPVARPAQPKPKPKPKPQVVASPEAALGIVNDLNDLSDTQVQDVFEPQPDVLTAMGIAPPPDDGT